MHHASEVPTEYLGTNYSWKRYQLDDTEQWNLDFSENVGPITIQCLNCNIKVLMGIDYDLQTSWYGDPENLHLGVTLSLQVQHL
jgi:hypothetical protein